VLHGGILMPDSKTFRETAIFLVLTFGISSVFYYLIARSGTVYDSGGVYIYGLMWSPGVSAIITSLIFRNRLVDLGFTRCRIKYILISVILPIVYASVIYVPVWLFGHGAINPYYKFDAVNLLILNGLIFAPLLALGEEIGWRGFLTPRLVNSFGFVKGSLVCGVIWYIYHVPVIISADYRGGNSLWFSLVCFAILVISITFLFNWLRIKSGSIWPAVVLHACHNLFIQGFFDKITADFGLIAYITGEFGIGLAFVSVIIAVIVYRKRNELPQAVTGQDRGE
jgi:CAAX protease family protein